MSEDLDDEAVRAELKAIITKVDDRGSLLFTKWLLTRISKNQPIPPIDEVKAQKKMTRVELSRRCRFPLRAILQLERGQVKDMTLPRLQQLADGLGVELGEFMDKVAEFEKSSKG
jgi:hypothetical protein